MKFSYLPAIACNFYSEVLLTVNLNHKTEFSKVEPEIKMTRVDNYAIEQFISQHLFSITTFITW